jgi:hypothetical protein
MTFVLHPSSEVLLRTLGVLSAWHRWQRKRKRAWFMLKAAFSITDRERWKNPSDPGYQTAERNRLIAAFIPSGSTVLDLGAGIQQLRRFIPRDCEYQPCDLDGGPDVLVCDFNAGQYPAVAHRYDVLVASGLLEFLRDPEAFLAQLPALGDTLLLSYRVRPPGAALRGRLASGYMSHLTTADLERMFDRLGYRWESVGVWKYQSGSHSHLQPIYRVVLGSPRPRLDARRTGRATAANRRRRSAAA